MLFCFLQATRAEVDNAKLIRVMSGAETVLERQTSRGLSRVGAMFETANRLVNRAMVQQVGISVAQELGASQVELKRLGNEVLDALWHMRGLTSQVLSSLSDIALPHRTFGTLGL